MLIVQNAAPNAGMTLLASGSVSSAATLDFVLTSYTAFRGISFLLDNFTPATDGTELEMRFSTDGGSTYISSGYNYAVGIRPDTGAVTALASGSAGQLAIAYPIGNASNEGYSGQIWLPGQARSAAWPRIFHTGYFIDNAATPTGETCTGGGANETAQDVDAVRFLFSSGNIASGFYAMYGWR